MRARLAGIWIKRAHRGPMDAVTHASVRAGKGLVGNADQGSRRQLTIIDQGAWDAAIESVGTFVEPAARRANLLLTGIALAHTRGRTLRIGECHFKVHGETRPCERMDEAQPGLQAALGSGWRGGVYVQALNDGEISVGQPVEWVDGND